MYDADCIFGQVNQFGKTKYKISNDIFCSSIDRTTKALTYAGPLIWKKSMPRFFANKKKKA